MRRPLKISLWVLGSLVGLVLVLVGTLLHMERTPVSKPDNKPSSNTSFPRSDLTQLTVDTLELGPSLAGAPTSLVVKGSAHWNSLQDTIVKLLAQRTGGTGNYDVQIRL